MQLPWFERQAEWTADAWSVVLLNAARMTQDVKVAHVMIASRGERHQARVLALVEERKAK